MSRWLVGIVVLVFPDSNLRWRGHHHPHRLHGTDHPGGRPYILEQALLRATDPVQQLEVCRLCARCKVRTLWPSASPRPLLDLRKARHRTARRPSGSARPPGLGQRAKVEGALRRAHPTQDGARTSSRPRSRPGTCSSWATIVTIPTIAASGVSVPLENVVGKTGAGVLVLRSTHG